MNEREEEKQLLAERFKALPKAVRQAIVSADVEKRLRELANVHKLHLDQWETLQNEVLLTLLGIQRSEDLQENIKTEVGVSDGTATILAADISKAIFEPVRQQLERELEHPDAKAENVSTEEAARRQILSSADEKPAVPVPNTSTPPTVLPATPPPAPPTQKAVRAMPASGAYKPGEPSAARKDVHDDPYRETPA